MTDVKRWLGDKEWAFYENILADYGITEDQTWFETTPLWHHKLALEALARRAKLLSEHQYDRDKHCVDCGAHKEQPCYSDCAIAAEIAGLPNKEEKHGES